MTEIKTFDKMKKALENYGLMQFIKANAKEKPLVAIAPKIYYRKLKKAE